MTDRDWTSDGDSVQPLHRLIRARIDERGWTYGQLVERSGGELSKSRWQQLATRSLRLKTFPEPATIQIMAQALEIDAAMILLSAGVSLGIDVRWHGPLLAQLLPAGTDRLSDQMRDAILAIIRAAVAEAAARDDGEAPDSHTALEWPREKAAGPSVVRPADNGA